MKIKNNLRKYRFDKGELTQQDLANAVGVTRLTIHSIEKGKFADLVVLDDNLFDIDRDRIWKTRPAAVLMEGKIIRGALPKEVQR